MTAIAYRSLLCSLLLLLASCGTTTLTDAWQEPAFHRRDMQSVLVVAVTSNKTNRLLFEQGFVNALRSEGIQAVASHTVIGSGMPTRESVRDYLHSSKMDHVIVTHYGGQHVTKEYVPESVRTYYTGPYYPYYGSYWDRNADTVTMTREAYVDTRTQVVLMTSIFAVDSEKLVWTGRSKSFEVGSISAGAKELAHKVVSTID